MDPRRPNPPLSSAAEERLLHFLGPDADGDADASSVSSPVVAKPQVSLVGRILGGCRLEEEVGRGGMGDVYRARHLVRGDLVAVKVLHRALFSSPKIVERFRREGMVAAVIDHPNVLRVLDSGSEDGVHFHVLPLVDGPSVAQLIQREGRIPWRDALHIAEQAALGLAAAHALGVVHRDIKPGNLLVETGGCVKVADFGLARQVFAPAGLTSAGRVVGTLCYAAPEQLEARPVDARTDLYSLGASLYTMIAGELPFTYANPTELFRAILQDPAPALAARFAEVPKELDALLGRLLAKEAEGRFGSATEAAEAMRSLREKPPGDAARWEPWGWRGWIDLASKWWKGGR